MPLQPFQFGAFEGKRRVASFGWRYDYSQHKLQQAEALPDWIAPVIARVEIFGGLPAAAIRQVLFTEYEGGAGIGWHRDKPHFGKVFGLSLLSACKFRFRRRTEGGWHRYTLGAEPRSLYMMAGESRHVWEQGILMEQVRYSVTFGPWPARTSVHLIEILLPVTDNEGQRFDARKYEEVREEQSRRFGGIATFTRAPAHGTSRAKLLPRRGIILGPKTRASSSPVRRSAWKPAMLAAPIPSPARNSDQRRPASMSGRGGAAPQGIWKPAEDPSK